MVNTTVKTEPGAGVAPNETLTLHFGADLAVVVHPHSRYESWELQGRGVGSAVGRPDGVNVLI